MTLMGDFIALTKPRVMSLLLVSAVAGAFIGAGSTPTAEVLIAVLIGGALASGGAASLNMAYESELDRKMGRTKNRPVAEGRVSARTATVYGLALNVGSFLILASMTNVLAAVLAIVGAAKDSSLGKIIDTPEPYRNCLRLISLMAVSCLDDGRQEGERFHRSNSPCGNRFFQIHWSNGPTPCPPDRRGGDPRQRTASMN